MTELTEGNRWFHIEQDRKRERDAWRRKAIARAATIAKRQEHVEMEWSEWTTDEHGNFSRTISRR